MLKAGTISLSASLLSPNQTHFSLAGPFFTFTSKNEMKRWLENKPRGFGEGKVYDTSIKEKLLQEIEQSREAHIANINKLKNDSVKTSPKKEDGKIKGLCFSCEPFI
ncbi:hypothetical protein ACOSQ2_018573 [Xanthoceras sorbifolium]